MSEKEAQHSPEFTAKTTDTKAERAEKPTSEELERSHTEQEESAEAARRVLESEAVSGKERSNDIGSDTKTSFKAPITKYDKTKAHNTILKSTQDKLSASNRMLSKVIHQPTVEKVSEITAKTVARPSSFVGGGLVTLLGSLFVLYMARTYGFNYNNTLFLLLFTAGATIGVSIEFLTKAVRAK